VKAVTREMFLSVKGIPSGKQRCFLELVTRIVQGGSNMTGTDLYVNKPHCAAAVRP